MKLKRISRESNYGEFATFGSGLSPQISYKYDNATTSWKKHYNIYDHLGTLAQTYKQSGFGATPTSMQTHNPYGGERWTNKNLTTKESTLLNWVGKEKDNESKLGDHGVRKYEYETGRFISIEPKWEEYLGWSPYQYSLNNPVNLVDIDGKDAIFLLDPDGAATAGHAALLVGDDDKGWTYISKDGAKSWNKLYGESDFTFNHFDNLESALSHKFTERYTKMFRISTSKDEDTEIREIAKREAESPYDILFSNCGDVVSKSLEMGLDNPKHFIITPGIPNTLYRAIKRRYRKRGKETKLQRGERDPNELPGKEENKQREYGNDGEEQ